MLIRLVDQVDVPSRAIGSLVEVNVIEGMTVRRGELLARIDDTESRLELDRSEFEYAIAAIEADDDTAARTARKSLVFSQGHFERLLRAKKNAVGSVSESELERARLEWETAKSDLEKAESERRKSGIKLKLSQSKQALAERNVAVRSILAPQDGMVVEVGRRTGEWVKPGETIFRIVNTQRLRVDGFIDADEVRQQLQGKSGRGHDHRKTKHQTNGRWPLGVY